MKIVKHKKRGTFYRVIGNATLQCAYIYIKGQDDREPIDGQQWRLYQSLDDGSFHVRPQDEFDDGRFEEGVPDILGYSVMYAGWTGEALVSRITELERAINTPHTDEFFLSVRMEAAHQIERWGSEHDEGKTPTDWLFLVGHLASKAATHQTLATATGAHFQREHEDKAKHHVISSAAALLNWFRAMTGDTSEMRPGIREVK